VHLAEPCDVQTPGLGDINEVETFLEGPAWLAARISNSMKIPKSIPLPP